MTRTTRDTPWWAREFEGRRHEFERYVERNFGVDAADVVQEVAASLVEQFKTPSADDPPAWLAAGPASEELEPTTEEVARFLGLVRTRLRFRALDRLRASYRRKLVPVEDADEAFSAETEDPAKIVDARRILALLAKRVDALPDADRELFYEASEVQIQPRPWSDKDRVRLSRLRKRLAEEIWRKFKTKDL